MGKKFRRGQTEVVLTAARGGTGAIDPAQVRRDEVPRAAQSNSPYTGDAKSQAGGLPLHKLSVALELQLRPIKVQAH